MILYGGSRLRGGAGLLRWNFPAPSFIAPGAGRDFAAKSLLAHAPGIAAEIPQEAPQGADEELERKARFFSAEPKKRRPHLHILSERSMYDERK
jgi:hypothetical protein